jgi:hypothetical protein
MPTIYPMRLAQRGKESIVARGTPVAATRRWIGDLELTETAKIYRPSYPVGVLVPYGGNSIVVARGAELSYSSDLTFEELPDFLAMGILGNQAGASASGAYTWTFLFDPDDDAAPDTFTVEVVNDDATTKWEREIEYVFCKNINISRTIGEPMKFKAGLVGRQVTDSTLTGGIGVPTVWEPALGDKLSLAIDDTWADLGVTPKAGVMIDMNLDIVTGLVPGLPTSTGLFSAYRFGPAKFDLTMTFEFTTIADAEQEKSRDRSKRFVRLEVLGSVVGSTTKRITFDLCGEHAEGSLMGPFGEREGQDTLSMHLEGVYDFTSSKVAQFEVVNSFATIP